MVNNDGVFQLLSHKKMGKKKAAEAAFFELKKA